MNKLFIVALVLNLTTTFSIAQKLDKIQTKSVWGPVYQRVDLDRSYQLEAFNPATEIFYTISNDKDKIYLQVQVQNAEVIEKAVKGGITFSISQTKTNGSDSEISVKYPVLGRDDKINLKTGYKPSASDENTKKLQIDTFVRDGNKKISIAAKTLKLSRSKAKPDTISIYNETGLQVLSFLDHNLYYNYQLAVPLSLLDSFKDKDSFFYNIALTGVQMGEFSRELTSGLTAVHVINGQIKMEGPTAAIITALMNKTDLSGEYKLARK